MVAAGLISSKPCCFTLWEHESKDAWHCGWENSTVSLSAALLSQTEFELSVWQWWVLGVQKLVAFAEHLQAGLVGLYQGRFTHVLKADEH